MRSWRSWVPRCSPTRGRTGRIRDGSRGRSLARAVHYQLTDLVVLTLGASLVILVAQRPGRLRHALLLRVPQFLGRISYSLYLVHIPVLLTVVILLGPHIEPILLLPFVWAIALAVGAVSERFVERPAQNLGRRLTRPKSRAGTASAEAVVRTEGVA